MIVAFLEALFFKLFSASFFCFPSPCFDEKSRRMSPRTRMVARSPEMPVRRSLSCHPSIDLSFLQSENLRICISIATTSNACVSAAVLPRSGAGESRIITSSFYNHPRRQRQRAPNESQEEGERGGRGERGKSGRSLNQLSEIRPQKPTGSIVLALISPSLQRYLTIPKAVSSSQWWKEF